MGKIMKTKSLMIGMTLLSFSALAQEGNLQTPMDFETTKVLPKGIRNLRFRDAMIQANDKYDSTGNQVPVGNALNKGVTFNNLIEGKESAEERAAFKALLATNGLSVNDEVGSTTGVANIAVDARIPILAYGVTPKLTTAFAVPVITSEVRTDSGSVSNGTLDSFAKVLEDGGNQDKAAELQTKFGNAVNEKLIKYGYEPLANERKTHVGDIRMINKYLLKEDVRYALAVRQDLTFPTGRPTSPNKAVDVASGDGQWDAGIGMIGDYFLNDHVQFTAYAGYLRQFATTTTKRIPEKSDSKLTPDVDQNTRMDLGDQIRTQLATKFYFLNGWNTNVGYTFQYREADKYTGGKYDAHRYAWMSQGTEQNMHAGQLGVGYSTINLFRQKRFPVPLEANVYHTRLMGGKNVVNDPLTTLEFAMFF